MAYAGRLRQKLFSFFVIACLVMGAGTIFEPSSTEAATGTCTAPATTYGTVTETVNIPSAGSYFVWSRIAADSSSDASYMLQLSPASGTSYCYTVGSSSAKTVPVYASGTSTHFSNDSSNWLDTDTSGSVVEPSLSAGNYTVTMIGSSPNLAIDRLIFTQDSSCTPSGTGDNCTPAPDTTPPVVSITSPSSGASISSTTTVTANATDNVAVQKVEFFVDGNLESTDTTGDASNNYTYSLNPASFSVGSHQLTAEAFDTSNNTATSSVVSFTIPDTTPPTISAISAGSITQTSATVTWTTNESANSQVKYGTTTSYGSTTTLNSSMVTSHSVNITGLTAGTTYHYEVMSSDASGNKATSSDQTFTTQSQSGDTTPPTVSLSAPANNATVSGTATVSANASDNVGVVGVQFQLDGANLGSEDTSSPYSISWNTTTASNGTHHLTAIARDAAGNRTTSTTVTVTVNNTSFNAADINEDGTVNFLDLSLLASNYGKSGSAISNSRADINGDGTVNFLDLSILASNYGK